MSEFTYSILVNDTYIESLANIMKKEKLEGYIFKANPNWIAAAVKNDTKKGTEIALRLSKKLNVYMFFFLNCEDYGWGYDLYKNGVKEAEIFIDYMKPMSSKITGANIQLLRKTGGKRAPLNSLQVYLNEFEKDPDTDIEGADSFIKAFSIETIQFTSYDYFQSSENIENYDGIFVGNQKKPVTLKSLIKNTIEPKVIEMGYTYDKIWSIEWGGSIFVKHVNGFRNALIISKQDFKDAIVAKLFSHTKREFDLFLATEGQRKEFSYSNDEDIKKYLKEILDQFISKGAEWLDKNSVSIFDAGILYDELFDKLFEEQSFYRIHTDENFLSGGCVIYKRGGLQLKLHHGGLMAAVHSEIIKDNKEEFLQDIIERNESREFRRNNYGMFFRNKEEYIELIKKNLYFINKYFP